MSHQVAFLDFDSEFPLFPTDSFLGREAELAELRAVLLRGSERIVTIVGPAGVGKSRLALELARNADEWFGGDHLIVLLASVSHGSEIISEVARVLGIVDQEEHLSSRVREALSRHRMLIVLDNIEHLIDGTVDSIALLIDSCPDCRIVTTSRHALDMPEERTIALQPLDNRVAGSDSAALAQSSVRLFIERARARRPGLRLRSGDGITISELCHRFDGLPLAIELVASWVDLYTPSEMLARPIDQFDRRTFSEDPRHHSMLLAIAWGYDLLEPEEKALFRRLSIFTGGFSREFVLKMIQGRPVGAVYPHSDGYDSVSWPFTLHDQVDFTIEPSLAPSPLFARELKPLALDPSRGLAKLLDHHLVTNPEDIDGVLCYGMLRTIREFGVRLLGDLGELEAVQHAHGAATVAFGEASAAFLWGVVEPLWGSRRIDANLPDIRQALAWSLAHGSDGAAMAIRIAAPLWIYWQTRGLIGEGRRWLAQGLNLPGVPEWLTATESPGFAFLSWIQNDNEEAEALLLRAIEVQEEIGVTYIRGFSYLVLALVEYRKPDSDLFRMIALVDEAASWFELWEDPRGRGACMLVYGTVARLTGHPEQALELFHEAYSLHSEGNYQWGCTTARYMEAETRRDLAATDPQHLATANDAMVDALRMYWEHGDAWGAGGAVSGFGCICAARQEYERAALCFGAASSLIQRVGGSLLPTELMTHADSAAQVRALLGELKYEESFSRGAGDPATVVEQIIDPAGGRSDVQSASAARVPRLTNRQIAVVRDLAGGLDIQAVARKRGRSAASTYEIVQRICLRLGVDDSSEIVGAAKAHGIIIDPQLTSTSVADRPDPGEIGSIPTVKRQKPGNSDTF